MKQTFKRLTALVLTLVICIGMLTVMGSAADTVTVNSKYTKMQQAIVETALAYWYRGPAVQYDSVNMTYQGKYSGDGADLRETDFASPEDGTLQDIFYTVCSGYIFEVYYDAFGYQLLGDPLENKTFNLVKLKEEDPIVVYRWAAKEDNYKDISLDTAVSTIRGQLQVGDVIVGYKDSGHTVMYLGDYKGDGKEYIIHCWGSKYDIDKGTDSIEKKQTGAHPDGGSIRIEECDAACFAEDLTGTYNLRKQDTLILLRPLNVLKEADMTVSAKARIQYSGLNIDRTANYNKFNTVENGTDITVTLKLQNNSAKAYTVPVTETVPANATLKDAGSASVSGNTLSWNAAIGSGETVELSYTVTASGKRGDVIDLSGGAVGGIRSNSIPITIGGKDLSDAQKETLNNVTKSRSSLEKKGLSGDQFAEAVYKTLGITVDIPSLKEVAEGAYERKNITGASKKMLHLTDKAQVLTFSVQKDMMVPRYHGGKLVKCDPKQRLLTYMDEQLQPGDIILFGNDVFGTIEEYAYIYIGDGRVAYLEEDRLYTGKAEKPLLKLLSYEYFVCLRPTLAYDDIAAATAPLAFTDVKEGDWYYTFVRDLVRSGTVSGMSDTSYAPSGTLTWGQALKLITLAAGETEQAAGTHWASGYLTLAKTKGWLTSDVDLNANITRLQFCQVAAKATGLTAQPEKNPFTDCSDTSVLAMVASGVVNGMTDTTFQPSGLLTRAQIAKIIWCIEQL